MAATARGRPRSFDRDAALDKAVLLFWRQGYEATSIRDLTDELGIGAPSLYSAFGDKEHLFTQALALYERSYGGFIDRALAQEPTARQAAARILREGPERYTRAGLPAGCLVVSGDTGTTNAAVTNRLVAVRARKIAELANRITADRDAGLLDPATDAGDLAQYTMAMLNGLANAARDGVSRARLRRVAQLALNAWP